MRSASSFLRLDFSFFLSAALSSPPDGSFSVNLQTVLARRHRERALHKQVSTTDAAVTPRALGHALIQLRWQLRQILLCGAHAQRQHLLQQQLAGKLVPQG